MDNCRNGTKLALNLYAVNFGANLESILKKMLQN